MAFTVNLEKTKTFLLKYKKLIVLSIIGSLLLALIVSISFATYRVMRSRETNKDAAASEDIVKKSLIDPGISTATIIETQANVNSGNYEKVRDQAELLLLQDNLTEGDKFNAYTTLATACLKLADFGCLDKVFAFHKEKQQYDYYTLVDAARLAKEKNKPEKAKEYYKLAFDDIEAKGGKEFLEKNTDGLQVELKYEEIAEGAK